MERSIENFRSRLECGCVFHVRILSDKDLIEAGALCVICCETHDYQVIEGAAKFTTRDLKVIESLRKNTI